MFRLALALCLLPALSFAQTVTAIDVSNLKEGESIVVTKKGGVITSRPLVLIVPGDQPTTPPINPPGTLTPFQAEIKRQTKAALDKGGTKTTGAAISSVYSLAADGLDGKTLDVSVAADAVRRGTTAVVNAQKEQAAWSEFAVALDDTITTLRARGDLKTAAQFSAAFRDVATGMDEATGFPILPESLTVPRTAADIKKLGAEPGILGNIDLAKLIELIKLIMELFKLFSPVMVP